MKKFLRGGQPKDVFISYATSWEISIKFGQGRIKLPDKPREFVQSRILRSGWLHMPIELEHVLDVWRLPLIHRDPFDRLLVSQAQIEQIPILSEDPAFKKYDVECITFSDLG